MHDIENQVYTKVAQELRSRFPNISIDSDISNVPASFPHVCLYEADNSVDTPHTSGEKEMDQITFTVEVYSNKAVGKKTEAKKIMNAIDAIMFLMNFVRLSKLPLPNMNNATIFRYVARYRVFTDGEYFYRR